MPSSAPRFRGRRSRKHQAEQRRLRSLLILNSAVGARQISGKLLMLNQCLCLESSTMANPFGEAL